MKSILAYIMFVAFLQNGYGLPSIIHVVLIMAKGIKKSSDQFSQLHTLARALAAGLDKVWN